MGASCWSCDATYGTSVTCQAHERQAWQQWHQGRSPKISLRRRFRRGPAAVGAAAAGCSLRSGCRFLAAAAGLFRSGLAAVSWAAGWALSCSRSLGFAAAFCFAAGAFFSSGAGRFAAPHSAGGLFICGAVLCDIGFRQFHAGGNQVDLPVGGLLFMMRTSTRSPKRNFLRVLAHEHERFLEEHVVVVIEVADVQQPLHPVGQGENMPKLVTPTTWAV